MSEEKQQTESQDVEQAPVSEPQETPVGSSNVQQQESTSAQPAENNGEQQQEQMKAPASYGNDDVPIGQKTKFVLDEFPPEGEQAAAAPKREIKKKPQHSSKLKTTIVTQQAPASPPQPVHLLDEVPVGGGKKIQISEYPDDEQPPPQLEQESSNAKLPLGQRLKSKVWKMRQSAFEELAENFDAAVADELYEEWPKLLNDANPGSQEKALAAFKVILEKCDQKQLQSRLDCVEVIKVLVDKCISPGKPQIKKIANEVLCDLFEKRDKTQIYEALKQLMNNKNAKVQAAAIASVIELLLNFGPKPLDYLKPFFPEVEKQAASTNSAVRQECMNFYKEALKWLGDAVLAPFTKNLKKAQLDEIEKFKAEMDNQPMKPLRGGAAVEVAAAGQSSGLDVYEIADAVDIFSKFNEKWCDKVLALGKWNERTQMLEEMIQASSAPKLVPAPNYTPYLAFFKKLFAEPNVNVNVACIKIIGNLVKGLRKHFSVPAKVLFPQLMLKLREKKPQLVQETKNAMDCLYYSLGVEDVIEDLKEGLNDKTAQLKVQVMTFISKNLELRQSIQYNKQKNQDAMKQLTPIIKKLLEDGVPEVRDAALNTLGKIKPFLSDQVASTLNDINSSKLQKVNEIAASQIKLDESAVLSQTQPLNSTLTQSTKKSNDKQQQQQQQLQQSMVSVANGKNQRPPNGQLQQQSGKGSQTPVELKSEKEQKDSKSRTNRTPKKDLKRNATAKDLNASLDTSSNFDSRQRTPGRSQQRKTADIVQPTKMNKPVFLEGSHIATSHSTKELKATRMSQPNNWVQETFVDQDVQDTIADIKLCLSKELSSLIMSYDYKSVLTGLKLLSQVCNDSVSKLNVVEISDLIYKWALLRVYGRSANEMLMQSINQFMGIFTFTLEKTGYVLTDTEVFIAVKVMREMIYANVRLDERFITSFIKIGGPDKTLRLWLKVIQTDHTKIHPFVDGLNSEKEFFAVLKNYMINNFKEDTFSEIAKFPGLQRYPDIVQELQRTYEQMAKRAGLLTVDPTSIAQQKMSVRQSVTNSPRTSQFKQCLNQLLSPQVAIKIESLMQVNDLIQQCDNNQPFPLYLFVNNASSICTCFHSLLTWSFMPGEQVPPQYKQFLLGALQKLYQLQQYVRAIPYEQICTFTEDLLLRLLHEDENKSLHDQGDQIVKQLNSTTLRILENTDPDMIFAILLDLLIKHRRKQQHLPQSKMVNLLVKCIIRVTKTLDKCIHQIKVDMLLLKFHNYMVEFSSIQLADDVGMKTIKTILIELVKFLGDRIWEPYQIIQQSDVPDQYIGPCIKMLLATGTNTSQIISPRQRMSSNKNENDSELKTISDMLKRPDQYDLGIRTLLELIKKNPGLQWQRYTMDCPKNVQLYIQQQIDRMNLSRQSLQPQTLPLATNNYSQNMMAETNTYVPNNLEHRVSLLQQRATATDDSQFRTTPNQQHIPQQLRTPEYLMQRLNDMKNKVQTLVGAPQSVKNNEH